MRSYLHNLPKALMFCGNNKIFQVGFSLVLGSLEIAVQISMGILNKCVSVWHSLSVNFTKEISLKFIQILRVGLHSNLRGLCFLASLIFLDVYSNLVSSLSLSVTFSDFQYIHETIMRTYHNTRAL